MNLQQFAIKNGFPLTKTSRVLRQVVLSHITGKVRKARDIREIEADCSIDEAGLHVRKARGHSRIQYSVTDPAKLVAFLVAQMRYDALSEQDMRVLVDAASFLDEIVRGETEWRLVQKQTGMPFSPNQGYFENLHATLQKARVQE